MIELYTANPMRTPGMFELTALLTPLHSYQLNCIPSNSFHRFLLGWTNTSSNWGGRQTSQCWPGCIFHYGITHLGQKLTWDTCRIKSWNHSLVNPPISRPGSPSKVTFSFFFRSFCFRAISWRESLTSSDLRTLMLRKKMSISGICRLFIFATRDSLAVIIICCSESYERYEYWYQMCFSSQQYKEKWQFQFKILF